MIPAKEWIPGYRLPVEKPWPKGTRKDRDAKWRWWKAWVGSFMAYVDLQDVWYWATTHRKWLQDQGTKRR